VQVESLFTWEEEVSFGGETAASAGFFRQEARGEWERNSLLSSFDHSRNGKAEFLGVSPSPWISGIIELGENSEVIYGAQWFRGKILSRKELAPVGRFSRIPLSPWLVSARWVRWPQGLGSHWCVIARRGFGKNECNVPSGSCEEIVFCRKGVRMRFRRWLLGRGEIEGLGFKWVLVRN
jgi:hypothetical protein